MGERLTDEPSGFKARDLVGLLLSHGARAYRASLPREFVGAKGPGFRLALREQKDASHD